MENLPSNFADYPLTMGVLMIGWYVIRYFLKREDEKSERSEQKDLAHIQALQAIQSGVVELKTDLKENWAVTEELSANVTKLSENVSKTAEALNNLQCLKKNRPE